ncbi:MarR family winged helix-turn-helix transcriptional regulator [Allonocardiopsis opalescens]|uniref:DNA-binding MarR family transcriptional regulator n=1 Tax=Allonocardiopsis opalescens TaxID=1144618 RepID=A0A2T0QAL6_9ACTN|nr:MarR family transcriptional regulator [Allonocardiopsis opalescens]PRY00887.1 DNA-binding MarR family transcriptional regulator [Allonocardiopsis opalescens]
MTELTTHADHSDQRPVPGSLGDYVGYLLRRVFDRQERLRRELLPDGPHPRDYAVLSMLCGDESYSQQRLADLLDVSGTIVVKLIDRLEEQGLVERRRNPGDRRSYILAVTEQGRRARDELAPAVERLEALVTEPLSAAETERLIRLLHALLPPGPTREAVGTAEHRGAFLLLKAYYHFRDRNDAALAGHGIAARHFGALNVLSELEPCPQQRLARRMGIAESVMVQFVDHLESAGLVERARDPADRRRYALRLTERGHTRLTAARAAVAATHHDITAVLGQDGHRELRSLLRRLTDPPPGTEDDETAKRPS